MVTTPSGNCQPVTSLVATCARAVYVTASEALQTTVTTDDATDCLDEDNAIDLIIVIFICWRNFGGNAVGYAHSCTV